MTNKTSTHCTLFHNLSNKKVMKQCSSSPDFMLPIGIPMRARYYGNFALDMAFNGIEQLHINDQPVLLGENCKPLPKKLSAIPTKRIYNVVPSNLYHEAFLNAGDIDLYFIATFPAFIPSKNRWYDGSKRVLSNLRDQVAYPDENVSAGLLSDQSHVYIYYYDIGFQNPPKISKNECLSIISNRYDSSYPLDYTTNILPAFNCRVADPVLKTPKTPYLWVAGEFRNKGIIQRCKCK